uniref:Amine oxidase domain-containing protein n=1 Tax=Triticum urartu TaxID=4572 RepID=A0A8R7P9E2_TRIUA
MEEEMRVAVVGAGVSGLAAAHELARAGGAARVTVYEAEESLGGHARTADVDGVHLDLGFMVFNRVTYPNMLEWFEELGVEMEISDMSLSVSTQLSGGGRCEWGSRNGLSGLLAQKSNALRPAFWHMIREILKFKEDALKYLEDHESNPDLDRHETLGQFIQTHGYSQLFQEAYLIPICASIWSCPLQGVLGFSAFFVLSFCRNHHLLQIFGRPQWLTVKGRSHTYVNKVREELESMGCQIKTSCQVKSVSNFEGGYKVLEVSGSEEVYDKIIFGAHAPDVLRMLGDEATHEELRILGAFQYVHSDIYLHRDDTLMPQNPSAWSAWNFLRTTSSGVSVTYWLNLLQNIESTGRPFLVTLNPPHVPDHVLLKWNTGHPVPSVAAAKASLELQQIQGNRGIWFCGAYQGYGFHEDGLKAGKSAAQGLLGQKSSLLLNPKQMVPSWTECGARLLVTRFLNQYVTIGNMTILEEGGTMFSFGEVDKKCLVKTVLRVHDPLFYWKVATEADLGMADAYINGYFSFVDKREGLLNLFLILIANRDAQKSSNSAASKRGWWTPMLLTAGIASAKYFLRHISRKNTVTQTRRNISQHYDLVIPNAPSSCCPRLCLNVLTDKSQILKCACRVMISSRFSWIHR